MFQYTIVQYLGLSIFLRYDTMYNMGFNFFHRCCLELCWCVYF